MAMADVAGIVKFHKEMEDEDEIRLELERGHDQTATLGALVYKGEDQFTSPIVACGFCKVPEVELDVKDPYDDPSHGHMNVRAEHSLLMSTANGEVFFKPTGEFNEKTFLPVIETSAHKQTSTIVHYMESVSKQLEEKYPELDLDVALEADNTGLLNLRQSQGEEPRILPPPMPFPADKSKPPTQRPPTIASTAAAAPASENASITITTISPPKGSIMEHTDRILGTKNSEYVNFESDRMEHIIQAVRIEAGERDSEEVVEDDEESIPAPAPAPAPAPIPHPNTSSPIRHSSPSRSTTPGEVISTAGSRQLPVNLMYSDLTSPKKDPSKTPVKKSFQSPNGVTEMDEVVSRRECAVPDKVRKKYPLTQYDPIYAPDQYPLGVSKHSMPVMNSSKVLSDALSKIDEKLENDDISVATIETSSTIRYRAAQKSTNVGAKINIYDYDKLTPLDDEEAARRAPRRARIAKQVDQAWLERRQNYCPSPEDTKVLYNPDPDVQLQLNFSNFSGSSGCRGDRKSSSFEQTGGLLSSIDQVTLTPSYRLSIDQEKIFGHLNPKNVVWVEDSPTVVEERKKAEFDDLLKMVDPTW